jgi:tellurite resistance protein
MSVTDKLRDTLASVEAFGSMVEEQAAAVKSDGAAAAAAASAISAMDQVVMLTRFAGMVEAACLIAAADGNVSAEESTKIADKLHTLTGGAIGKDKIAEMVKVALANAKSADRDKRFAAVAERLSTEAERETVFTVAAHAAWGGGGIGVQEGLALQAIARAFGWQIPHMHKLLGKARG